MMMEVSIHFSELGRPDRFSEMNSIPIHCCKFLGKFLLLLLRVPTKCWASKNAAVFMSFPPHFRASFLLPFPRTRIRGGGRVRRWEGEEEGEEEGGGEGKE